MIALKEQEKADVAGSEAFGGMPETAIDAVMGPALTLRERWLSPGK
jgi:hypothetical protein